MLLDLEMHIEDGIHRIKDLYDKTNGKCCISFSGGKDSTIVLHLYLIAKKKGLVGEIPIIFADTRVEYKAIYDFVKYVNENIQKVIYLKPEKNFNQVLKEYGKPAMSKIKSDWLGSYQKKKDEINFSKSDFDRLYNYAHKKQDKFPQDLGGRAGQLLIGIMPDGKSFDNGYFVPKVKNGKLVRTQGALANKHMHFAHKDQETKYSSKCCDYLKKKPFAKYYKDNDISGYMTGVRVSEGGVRSMMYKTCTSIKKLGKKELIHKMPIFDWSDEISDEFIEKYNIKISEAYTKYGLDRTGCIGCPFAKDIATNLKVLYEYEKPKYKACMHWLKEVYIDLEVELPFDEDYELERKNRQDVINKRRYEMLLKYRPNIAHKWKPEEKQINLFDVNVLKGNE